MEDPLWKIYGINDYLIEVDFGSDYGPQFGCLNHKKPESVLLAEGSEVVVKAERKF